MKKGWAIICLGLSGLFVSPTDAFCGLADGYAEQVMRVPGLIRYYPFDGDFPVQSNRVGAAGPMRFPRKSGVKSEPGLSGSPTAPRFADESFTAEALPFSSHAFTFSFWVKPLGMGKAGKSDFGLLCECGDGWRQGVRVAVPGWRDLRPVLTIGHAVRGVAVKAEETLTPGFWNHLAATYDGAVAKVYLNGACVAEQPYAQPLVPTKNGLRVGSVGSLDMAVSDLAVFGRALDAREVSALFLPEAQAGIAAGRLAEHCRKAPGQVSARKIESVLAEVRMNADTRHGLEACLAESALREGDHGKADALFKRLLAVPESCPGDAAALRWRYAAALLSARRFGEARQQFGAIGSDPALSGDERGFSRLAVAGSYRLENLPAQARDAYVRLAGEAFLRPHLREEAKALAGECERLMRGLPARDPAAGRQPPPDWRKKAPHKIFYVAPDGSDTHAGGEKTPFATLERAREAVREARDAAGGKSLWVLLRGGRYSVTNTFELTAGDSGAAGGPVVYAAYPGETPVLDGGCTVTGFARVGDGATLARLPEEARGHVRVADLKALCPASFAPQPQYGYYFKDSHKTVYDLYQDGEPLRVARWPNTGYLHYSACDNTNHTFTFATGRAARWKQADELMAFGWWTYLWGEGAMRAEVADPVAGVFRLPDAKGLQLGDGMPFYVFNLLEELDQPGEWFLDRANARLYVWPEIRTGWLGWLCSPRFVFPRFGQPFLSATNVRHVVIDGLTLEHGRQHGLVFGGCSGVCVANCDIRRFGGTGIVAENAKDFTVYGNRLHTFGHGGIVVRGNRDTAEPCGNSIENNEVGHFELRARTYNPALQLDGVGARAAHNYFHHGASSALRVEGSDLLIEYNRIEKVVQESDDQGGLDMCDNPFYSGNVIRFNYWKDFGGGDICGIQGGIRLDDAICRTLIYGNVFERVSAGGFGAVQIHGGQQNIIDNNVFTECRYGVSFTAWDEGRFIKRLDGRPLDAYLTQRLHIPEPSGAWLKTLRDPQEQNRNFVWRSRFCSVGAEYCRFARRTELILNRSFEMPFKGDAPDVGSVFRTLPPVSEMGRY